MSRLERGGRVRMRIRKMATRWRLSAMRNYFMLLLMTCSLTKRADRRWSSVQTTVQKQTRFFTDERLRLTLSSRRKFDALRRRAKHKTCICATSNSQDRATSVNVATLTSSVRVAVGTEILQQNKILLMARTTRRPTWTTAFVHTGFHARPSLLQTEAISLKTWPNFSLPAACPSLVLEIWSQRTRAIKAGGASN